MFLRHLDDVRGLFTGLKGSFSGVGITAYSRIVPSYLIQPYYIVALRQTGDLAGLGRKADIFCLEEAIRARVKEPGFNSSSLLSAPQTRAHLKTLPDPKTMILYQNYPELEATAKIEGWRLLANPSLLRMKVVDRSFFYQMAKEIGLNRIPGDIFPLKALYRNDYTFWAGKFASRFVLQLPEIKQGGGRGTFFIQSPVDYQGLLEKFKEGKWRGKSLNQVAIHKFIEGTPISMTLCLTRHGILYSDLQRQIIDLPYCRHIPEDGVFCGHSWGESPWPDHIREEAKGQARLIGNYLAAMGYKGILGVDFIMEKDEGGVYPLEINPRYTGAFPMLSQFHIQNQRIPMDAFHILEFLDIPYRIDVEGLNEQYAEPFKGGHLLLFERPGKSLTAGHIKAGVYTDDPDRGEISFAEETMDFMKMKSDKAFMLLEGPSDETENPPGSDDPFKRLCRLVFPRPIVDDRGRLRDEVLHEVKWVYDRIYGKG